MTSLRVRNGWVGRLMTLLGPAVLLTACSTTMVVTTVPAPATTPATAPAAASAAPLTQSEDDFSQLIAQLRADLTRAVARVAPNEKPLPATTADRRARDKAFAARANALFSPLSGTSLHMPVVGIRPRDLYDSWGDARDGGRRRHKGIDIFAPKGTPVVAVADGLITYIGDQPKGGLCLWLTTEDGSSFYYAHLDRWAPGLYEGMEVRSGDLLGYVGNTGNARSTPPHLHFGISDNDEMVNPYPILTRAAVVQRARVATDAGAAMGTR